MSPDFDDTTACPFNEDGEAEHPSTASDFGRTVGIYPSQVSYNHAGALIGWIRQTLNRAQANESSVRGLRDFMRAMVLERAGQPLVLREQPMPAAGAGEVLIDIFACGVCRTDLHIVDGELDRPKLPLVPGHEIVGRVRACGSGVIGLEPGMHVGVPWLGSTCGNCPYCLMGAENLCDAPLFTGYTRDGGYAEACIANAAYVFMLPEEQEDAALAPLLCAGLIGHRALRMCGDAERIGLYGFGAAAHIVAQVAVYQRRRVFAFTRPGDEAAQAFAHRLGAEWAGGSDSPSPEELDAAIIFAPVGALVPTALRAVRKGGVVVCGGIHMSDIPSFPYSDLWGERRICSVANLTRRDGDEFLALVGPASVTTEIERFPLEGANDALDRLRSGTLTGAAVLLTGQGSSVHTPQTGKSH